MLEFYINLVFTFVKKKIKTHTLKQILYILVCHQVLSNSVIFMAYIKEDGLVKSA